MVRFDVALRNMLFMALTLTAYGCSALPGAAMATPEPVIVRFAYAMEEKGDAYQVLAAEFGETHPNITVVAEHSGDVDQISRSAYFDVFEADQFHLASLAGRGAILNLDPILREDPHGIANDFYPNVLNAFTWHGQIWAVPADVDVWVLYFNKDLFDQAGVAYPEPDWTWSDLLEKAAALTEDLGDRTRYGLGADSREAPELIAFIYQHGGTVVDSIIDPQTPTLTSPATIEAVKWYTDLDLVHAVMTPPEVIERYRGSGVYEAAVRQHVAMWIGPLSARGGLLRHYDWRIDWGVVPLPRDEQRATLFTLSGYYINTYTAHPHEAWEWIEKASGSPRPAWSLPPRRSVADVPSYRQRVGEEVAEAALTSAQHGLAAPPVPWMLELVSWLNEALTSILTGEQTVEEAMQGVQEKAEVALSTYEVVE